MGLESRLFEPLTKGSISEVIIQRITDAIISGELKPGDKIPTEVEFSEQLGVGRNAVREAIKVLVAFGVLEIRRSEGTFVVEKYNQNLLDPMLYGVILSDRSMEELLDFKISLHTSTLYLAVRNATDEDLKGLRPLWQRFRDAMLEEPGDENAMYGAGIGFARYLAKITRNDMFAQLDAVALKISTYTRIKAIEASIATNRRHILPDEYLKDVELLERREKHRIPEVVDQRLAAWKELLL